MRLSKDLSEATSRSNCSVDVSVFIKYPNIVIDLGSTSIIISFCLLLHIHRNFEYM
ncbi:Hypothetical protein FKW44_008143, partial [Caligus rogercresseyi]